MAFSLYANPGNISDKGKFLERENSKTSHNEIFFARAAPVVTASVSGSLTCTSVSVTLSATSTSSGLTYAWTGPNGFTSTLQNPVVSIAGSYTVTGTSSAGSGTATVSVTQNITAPGATATVSGNLACTASSVTLTGASSTSGVTYFWSGPNGFTSSSKTPSVSIAGIYTLTVTNPVNGCTSTQAIQVNAGTTSTGNVWLEDFTLANGTTADAGITSWSTQSSQGTFSVNTNEFRVNNNGTNENVWTSGVVDITGKANVTLSVDVRSGVSTGGALENSGSSLDYVRMYYKLNNGSEILFNEQLGTINSNSSTNTTVSIASLSGTNIQIVIRARATSSDEFYYFDNVKVVGTGQSGITATASVGGTLTCSTTSVTLSGSASVSGATFSWVGPNGFTSSSQNTAATVPGNYTLTASTSTGCSGTAVVNVAQNIAGPDVTATGSTLPCSGGTTTITASTSISNPQYTWIGPNGFTSTAQNPSVTQTGSFTVTVKNLTTGCTTSKTVQVVGGSATVNTLWLEDFTLANGTAIDNGSTSWSIQNTSTGAFSVNNNEFRVNNIGTSTVAVWSSGIIDISASTDISLSVDLRSSGALENSGSSLDYVRAYYKLNGGQEVLFTEQLGSVNGNSTTNSTFSISALSGSDVQIIIRSRTTTSDEFYYFDNVKVSGKASPVGIITASVNGTLSCLNPTVQLSSSVTTSGATYSWIAPNGATINSQNPTVSAPGNYTAVVKVGLCQGTKIVTVPGSVAPPDISIIGANLSCTVPGSTAALTTYSTIPNLVYSWTGPGGVSSSLSGITASVPGIYFVSVTNPVSHCTNSASFVVGYSNGASTPVWNEDFEGLADGTMVDNGGTAWSVDISKIHTVDLSAYSGESGTPYYFEVKSNRLAAKTTLGEVVWTSQPIDISTLNQVQLKMDISGQGSLNDETDCGDDCFDYDYVNIYYKLNGGVEIPFSTNGSFPGKLALNNVSASTGIITGNTVQIIFRAYNTGNNEFYYFDNISVSKIDPASATITASVSGKLTCTNNSVTLTASPAISGATYNWSGPGGFTTTGQTIIVAAPGTYTLSVTGASTCSTSSSVSVVVEEDKVLPVFSVNVPAILTCSQISTTLQASSSSALSYTWTRPDASTASGASLIVTTPGTYKVVAIDPLNGCSSEKTIVIQQNIVAPGATAAVSGSLNCIFSSVTLSGSSPTSGVTYSWAGPGGYTSSLQNPIVAAPGTFTLTVTNPTNGCSSTAIVNVIQNINAPGATAGVSGSLSCTNTSVTLSGNSSTSGVSYSWTGPNSFTSAVQNPTTSVSGTYTLTVTNPANGCTSTATVNVIQGASLPGATASVSGSLTCTNASVSLLGSSPTTGVTYGWTGPGSFTSAVQNPVVSAAGTYVLTVTNPANGCISTASVNVIQNSVIPANVTATVSGQLNCTNSSVTLTGSSTTSGATFQWTGPNSFTSTAATTSVAIAGTYNLTVTNPANGCTSSASVNVIQNSTLPGAIAFASGALTCSNTTVTLTGSSSTSGVIYGWTGPGGFTSNLTSFTTSTAGSYIFTVTNPVNGCISSTQVIVLQNITPPGATASVSGPISCTNATVTLSGSSTTTGVSYSWTGPGSFTSSSQNPSVSVAGTYVLTVFNPANGCTSTASVNVTQSASGPGATAGVSGPITCTATSVTISGSSATSGVTYGWSGPGSFTSTSQNVSVSTAGTYTLTVTNPANGCTSVTTVNVIQNIAVPNVSASVSGQLNCINSAVTITGASTTSGATFKWTGPGSFNSTSAIVSVAIAGTYNLVVTNPANGCTSSTSVSVIQNSTLPGATAFASGALTCSNTSVTLTGTSTTSGVTFGWTGPGSFTSSASSFTTSTAGSYIFTVTNPANGCISSTQVIVLQNIAPPGATTSVSGQITCTNTSVTVTGSSTTSGVAFLWTGPGSFTSNSASFSTSTAGTYTLTVTNPANGCTSVATANVIQNLSGSTPVISVSSVLSCTNPSVVLTGTSQISGALFSWTGPNGFTSTSPNPTVTNPGIYVLTVVDPSNGCSASAQATVQQVSTPPGASASVSGVLNCSTASVNLVGTSPTSGVNFKWTGPSGVISTVSTTSVAVPGTYTLTVTNPVNECISTATVVVQQVSTPPGATASVSGILTCSNLTVTLTGSSPVSGVNFQWSGPNGFTASSATTTTSNPGNYILTVTNPANGCASTANVTVQQNGETPGASASVSGLLTCTTTSVTLTGSSSLSSGVSFLWTGPGSLNSTSSVATATLPGIYTFKVTNTATGCISTTTVDVQQNIAVPTATAAVSGSINCTNSSVALIGSSTSSGVSFKWTGPSGFSANGASALTVNPGTYTLTVTNPLSGCFATANVVVSQDIAVPNVSASVSGTLSCTSTSVNLIGSSSTAGVTFKWTGPGSFTSTSANVAVSVAGNYTLTVTNPSNGCTAAATVTVSPNTTLPGASASVSGVINCSTPSVTITGSSTTSGVNFSWAGPSGFTSAIANPTVSVPGSYTVTVTNPANGCVSSASVTVQQNSTGAPVVTASVSGPITCTTSTVTLTGASSTSGVTFLWTGPNSFSVASQNTTTTVPGTYTLAVTSPGGCTSSASVNVIQNVGLPNATAAVSGTLTCSISSVTLQGSSTTSGVTYAWVGPGSFTSTSQNVSVSTVGTYTLTVTNTATGCFATAPVNVTLNNTAPGASISSSGSLTCTATSVTLSGSSATSGVTYSWAGPGSFASTSQNVSVSTAGVYTLTVTNPANGCTSIATSTVTQNATLPNISASASSNGILTCTTTAITLSGSSTTSGVTYSWTGPGSFTSTSQNISVSTAGAYTLKVTSTATGCFSTVPINVTLNNTAPGASISSSGSITCTTTSVTLSGSSTTSGVTYSWTGPGSFASTSQNVSVSAAGAYTLTVTNPVNGCISTATSTVTTNTTAPNASASASSSGILTCTTTSVTLSGSSTTSGVTYSWTGPGSFTSTSQNISVSAAGAYTLKVTNTATGCFSNAPVINVTLNNTAPGANISSSGSLTCTTTSVTLSGSSTTTGVTYSWTGPGSFASTSQNVSVSTAGVYNLTVTNPANGCTSVATSTVTQNATLPNISVSASSSGILTCTTTAITLSGSSATSGVTYSWTGPGSFVSALQNVSVSVPGAYTLKVTNTSNGCFSTASTTVLQNIAVPDLTAPSTAQQTCTTLEAGGIALSANSSVPNAQYTWTVPAGFEELFSDFNVKDLVVPFAFIEGDFVVTVKNPVNGCVNSKTVTVTDNSTPPACFMTFRVSTTTLSVDNTPGATYLWSVNNPSWSIGTGQGTEVISVVAGPVGSTALYSIIITTPSNGCAEDCSLLLTRTSTGIVATTSGFARLANEPLLKTEVISKTKVSAYPNPFNDKTAIKFTLVQNDHARLEVYTFAGKIATIFDGKVEAGKEYEGIFDGHHLARGIYFYRLVSKQGIYEGKLILAP